MKVCLIFPTLPPNLGGISHYTARQATELAARGCEVTILMDHSKAHALPGITIKHVFRGGGRQVKALREAVQAERPDWLLLQYNPLSYSGRWGFNPFLPLLLRAIKRTCPGTRIGLVVHEAFGRLDSWRQLMPFVWQRAQLWLLGRYADLMLCAIEQWASRLKSWFPRKTVEHLPVGSNIPMAPVTPRDARQQLGLADAFVLGLFGSAAYSRRLELAREAVQALQRSRHDVRVLYVGTDGASMRSALGEAPFIDAGALPAEGVSRHLAAMDLFLAPFRDGVSARRGSFMAALQHGLPTVTTVGESTDQILREHIGTAFVAAPEEQPRAFARHVLTLARDAERRAALKAAAQQLYASHFSWDATTTRLLAIMQKTLLTSARSPHEPSRRTSTSRPPSASFSSTAL